MVCNYIIEIKENKTFDLYLDNKLMELSKFEDKNTILYYITTEGYKSLLVILLKENQLYLIGNIININYDKINNKIHGTVATNNAIPYHVYEYDDNVQRSSPDGGVELQVNGRRKILDLYDHYRYDI